MKKLLLLILAQILLCTLIFGGGIIPPKQDPNNPQWVKGEILVKFKNNVKIHIGFKKGALKTGVKTIDELISKWKISDLEKVFKTEKKRTETKTIMTYTGKIIEVPQLFNIYKLKFSKKINVKEVIEDFKKNTNIEYAEPNYIAQICVEPDDPGYSQQWGLPAIHASEAWDIETGDSTSIIGIIDTGIEWDHPDLYDNIWNNWDEIPDNGIDDDGNGYIDDVKGWNFISDNNDPYDDNGHGTHVSGIAAASTNNGIGIAGTSWGSKIMIIKALSHTGTGSYGDLAQSVNYAANNGAKVINMSLGGYANSYTLKMAIENAYTTSVIVAAAGNDGYPVEKTSKSAAFPFFPAAYSFVNGVISRGVMGISLFSNFDPNGPIITNNGYNYEVVAPGEFIYSTMIGHSYASLTGTSMAAPFVSGTVALLRSHFPDWSNELLMGQLIQSSGFSINAYAALTLTPEPVLASQEYTVIDTLPGCDQDGIADAGETIEMVFTVKNFWAQADTVEMTLRLVRPWHDSTYVNIIDSVSTLGSISAYATKNNENNPFVLDISSITPNNSNILMEYSISCANSDTVWSDTFWLTTQKGTNIHGIISEDTTLSNDYLYIVNGNMLVNPGITLTIEPGTRIQFDADKYLRIDGCLIAIGVVDSMIVFTSNCQTHTPGDWATIKFTGSSEDAVFDTAGNYLSGSILKYSEIELGKGVSIDNCSPYIVHSTIHDNCTDEGPGSGIYLNNSNSHIENNLIYENNASDSWTLNGYGAGIGIRGGSPFIAYNIIESNYGTCLGGGIAICEYSTATVTNNVIRGNYTGSYSYGYGGGALYMECGLVTKNIIYDNYTYKWGGGSPDFPCGGGVFFNGGTFQNNTLINNKQDGFLIKKNGSINNNNIINNRGSTPLYDEYDFFEIRMRTGDAIDCSNNYWGNTNTDTIDDYIWDFLDDFDYGLVTYEPFATSPVVDAPGFLYQVEFNPPPPIGCETDTFNLTFSKPMDISIQPNVKFGVCEPYTQHIIEGVWIDSTNWQGTYTFGIMTGDGINNLRVTTAEDCEAMEIPKDTRFSFVIDATGASSVGFIAQAGIGKVDLEWNGQDMVDFMGYNMYRYHKITDTTYSDTTLINTSMITDTIYCDMSVIPNTHYKYMYTGISTDFIESDYSDPASATPFDAANGDANGDLAVDVLDITTIVSYMLNQSPSPFLFDAADVNYDNEINVLDIIGLVQLISGDKTVPLTAFVDISDQEAFYEINDNKLLLESEGNVVAMQFKLKVKSEKLKVENTIDQLRIFSLTYGFEFAYSVVDDEIIGICYSMSGKEIPEGICELFRFEGVDVSNIEIVEIFGGDLNGDYVPVLKKGQQVNPQTTNDNILKVQPNPFTQSTVISWQLAEDAMVDISIYDLKGEKIKQIKDTYQSAGIYQQTWNATDNKGKKLTAGIYICHIEAKTENQKITKDVKIILMR